MKGKVTRFDAKVKLAELSVEGKDSVFVADRKKLNDAGIETLNVGDEVSFIAGHTKKGNRITVLKILAEDEINSEDFFQKIELPEREVTNDNELFTNPYNFVPVVKIPDDNKIGKFRKPFISHEKFEGCSGIITCRLKTLTPFFTSASHSEDDKGGHKRLEFFSVDKEKINGQENEWRMPTVPGSTLRGVIRSVCEAVSNSSFTALGSETLDYRCSPDESRFLKCGIVTKVANDSNNGEIKELNKAKLPFLPDEDNVIPNTAEDTMKGWALVEDENRFVKVVVQAKTDIPVNRNFKEGFFKLTGRSIIENKKNERFFFEDAALDSAYAFSLDEQRKYNEIISNQNKNAQKEFTNSDSDIATQEISERKNYPLSVGHLVYFKMNGENAENLGYVSIPRWQYKNAIHEKIDKFFHPDEDADSLCPTSRIFGFVRDKKISKKKNDEGKSSYAGRVFFSDATFDSEKGKVKYDKDIVLDILGSPKPTTFEFYLYNSINPNQAKDYDDPNTRLRGRKFYLHQEDKGQYRRKNNEETPQNSTLKKVLAKDNEFVFTVRFDNLEEYELGLLLWSLSLEDGMAHKIGMGKPLGLGSVSIEVESLEIIYRKTRYEKFLETDDSLQTGISENKNRQNEYVSEFTNWMKGIFGRNFNELENVKALKNILKFQNSSEHPIHYPLPRNSDEKQFEWFVENRRINNSQVLPFPNPVENVPKYLKRNEKPRRGR